MIKTLNLSESERKQGTKENYLALYLAIMSNITSGQALRRMKLAARNIKK